MVNIVIIPHSGWDPNGPGDETHWTTVFRNASGILRYKIKIRDMLETTLSHLSVYLISEMSALPVTTGEKSCVSARALSTASSTR